MTDNWKKQTKKKGVKCSNCEQEYEVMICQRCFIDITSLEEFALLKELWQKRIKVKSLTTREYFANTPVSPLF